MEPAAPHPRDAEPVPAPPRGTRACLRLIGKARCGRRPPADRRHDRHAEGRDAHPPQPGGQRGPGRGLESGRDGGRGGERPLRAPVLPHLRPDRGHELRDADRRDPHPPAALRPGRGALRDRPISAAALSRRADHVPDPGRPSRCPPTRPAEHRRLHQRGRTARSRGPERVRGGHRRAGRRGLRAHRGVPGHPLQPGPWRAAQRHDRAALPLDRCAHRPPGERRADGGRGGGSSRFAARR